MSLSLSSLLKAKSSKIFNVKYNNLHMRVPESVWTEEYFSHYLSRQEPKSIFILLENKKAIFKSLTCKKNKTFPMRK